MDVIGMKGSVFRSEGELIDLAITECKKIAKEAVAKRGRFVVALSGGKSPVVFYRKLTQQVTDLPWDKTHIFLVDERFVPVHHKDSNYRLVRQYLGKNTEHIYPMVAMGKTLEESAALYAATLQDFFQVPAGAFPCFDLIILGMGSDGHTASLFPGHAALQETKKWVVPVVAETVQHERITFTLPVINHARHIMFLITGARKATMVRKILAGDHGLPVQCVQPIKGELLFLIDKELL